jgi:O-antigen ligase
MRKGFLHRYALASGVIGVLLLPHLNLSYEVTAEYQRAGLDTSVGLSNGNALAAWFGFCCVYAIVRGIETTRAFVRIVCLLVTIGALFVVGLTVSRGALVGIALATLVAICRSPKRVLVPVLLLAVSVLVGVGSGLFDEAIDSYGARRSEETGRLLTWPIVIREFLSSPLAGTGVSKAEVFVDAKNEGVTPHNGFLFLALTSGIMPLVFFSRYWWLACKGAIGALRAGTPEAPFMVPLVLYTFVTTLLTNQAFMYDWAVVTLSIAVAAGTSLPSLRLRRASAFGVRGRSVRGGVGRPGMVQ